MNKYDLNPFRNTIKTLFMLESPDKDELELGYPCAGKSGNRMSGKIFNDNSIAFGKILKDESEIAIEYGIFNSCQFPLNIKNLLSTTEFEIANVTTVGYDSDLSIKQNLDLYVAFLSKINNLNEKTNYTERLNKILFDSPNLKTLVICGYIAQAFFQRLFYNETIIKFNTLTPIKITKERILNVLYVKHPSPKANEWNFRNSSILT
jgi:hypothetical protein